MAVLPVGATNFKFQCISSDEKPIAGMENGATMHVITTGEQYVFHNGAWEPDRRLIYALSLLV